MQKYHFFYNRNILFFLIYNHAKWDISNIKRSCILLMGKYLFSQEFVNMALKRTTGKNRVGVDNKGNTHLKTPVTPTFFCIIFVINYLSAHIQRMKQILLLNFF